MILYTLDPFGVGVFAIGGVLVAAGRQLMILAIPVRLLLACPAGSCSADPAR